MRSLNKDYGNKRPLFHQKNHQNRYYQPIDTKAKTFLTCTPIASDGYAHTCTPIASDVGRKVPPRSKWRRFMPLFHRTCSSTRLDSTRHDSTRQQHGSFSTANSTSWTWAGSAARKGRDVFLYATQTTPTQPTHGENPHNNNGGHR